MAWQTRRPHHWSSEGQPSCREDLRPWSEEGTSVDRLERWESQAIYMPFAAYRQTVAAELQSENVELWLFHGTDAVDAVLDNGFRISHANLDVRHNRYGVGVYFARDPRLAHYFAQMSRGKAAGTATAQVILARVVVGLCAKKAAVKEQRQLLRPEHREPPTGFHSCTSDCSPGREVIVFPGSPGTPAYPAYVITYKYTSVLNNPYRDPDLLRVDFEDRGSANVFQRYRKQFRQRLSWQTPQAPMRRSSFPTVEDVEPRDRTRKDRPSTSSGRLCKHVVAPASKTDGPAKAGITNGVRPSENAKSAPNTPRLAHSGHPSHPGSGAKKKCKQEGAKSAVPRARRGRRASSPAAHASPVPDACKRAASAEEVPVKTLWIFDESEGVRPPEVQEEPLSSQARRRSGFALSCSEAAVTWRAAAALPVVASRLAAATLPGRAAVMALGGADALGFSLDAVHVFENSKWTPLPPLPTARHALAAASLVDGGCGVCALGGRTTSSGGSATVDVDFFDLGVERWVKLPPLTGPRAFHASAALEGRIYVLGGMDADGRRLASVDWLDPREGRWQSAPSLLSPRSALAACALDGLYAVGGLDLNGATPRIEHLNLRLGSWISMPSMPTARGGLAASSFGGAHGVLVAIGGRRGAGLSAVERFVPRNASWSSLASLPLARSALAAAPLDEQSLLVVGGLADTAGALSTVERFELRQRMT